MTETLTLIPGSKEFEALRERYTETIPGKKSALYALISEACNLGDKIPMTYSAHYALSLFAEGATGIPQIDKARVRLIQVARGFGKSAIVTKGLPLLRLLRDRDYSVGIGNETQRMCDKFLAQIKEEFTQNQLLRALFPETLIDPKQTTWSASEIIINRTQPRPTSPSVLSIGCGGTVTGTHVDEWIIDDLFSRKLAENAMRGLTTEAEGVEYWIDTLPPLLCSPMRDPITFIGTPWYAGDPYEYVERKFGYIPHDAKLDEIKPDFETIWRLVLPDGTVQHIPLYVRGDIAVFKRPAIIDGESIFPERWTLEELERMRFSPQDTAFFQANYMLDPASGMATAFSEDMLRVWDWDGRQIRYWDADGRPRYTLMSDLVTYISLDPAFSSSDAAARTAITVTGLEGPRIFLLEDFADFGMGIDDMVKKVVDFYLQYKPRKIFLETIGAQIAIAAPLARALHEVGVMNAPIEEIPSHGKEKKIMRIYGLEPFFQRGAFFYHPAHKNFLSEFRTFPRGKLRDVLDALSFQRDEWETMFSREQTQHGDSGIQAAAARHYDRYKESLKKR
jgi:phage terminase large subunit-like protein